MFFDDEDITESIRDAVFDRDGESCWLCGDETTGVNISHQIHAAAFRHPFSSFKANGTIGIPDLSHPDNLIPLCGSCHIAYDMPFPEWIMVPDADTLRQFIDHELNDYERRQSPQAGSLQGQGRTLPDIDRKKVLYHPVVLYDKFNTTKKIATDRPIHWQGDPTTVIHRSAWHGLLDSNPIQPIHLGMGATSRTFHRGIQPIFPSLIGKLIRLWARPVPR
jgi:hypothetical protein